MEKTKKITLSTVKSFVRKNSENLFINVKSSFDGMTDCCESQHEGFQPVEAHPHNCSNTLDIKGAWFVGGSRDYFSPFENETFTGIQVSNSCGRFVLAVKKPVVKTYVIEDNRYSNTVVEDLVNDRIISKTTIDEDLSTLSALLPSVGSHSKTVMCGRGGNHIWISRKDNNDRVAIIYYKTLQS